MADDRASSPPRKKLKLESTTVAAPRMNSREEDVGITAFVNPDVPGFSGVFKKRYTDFLVNEVLPSGEVVHLKSMQAPKSNKPQPESKPEPQPQPEKSAPPPAEEKTDSQSQPQAQDQTTEQSNANSNGNGNGVAAWQEFSSTTGTIQLTAADESQLKTVVDDTTATALLALFNKVLANPNRKARDHGNVTCPAQDDKEKRTQLHQAIRGVFRGRLESYTEGTDTVVVKAAAPNGQTGRGGDNGNQRGGRAGGGGRNNGSRGSSKPSFQELGGDYLHFTLFKENRDTMEVVSFLARELHIKPAQFQFAGTKDRRGVTVQKISVYRIFADRLVAIGRKGRGWKIGDFEYKPYALALGDLTGNEFTITLRDVKGEHGNIAAAVQGLQRGFLNYYGLQRFGTFATRTDTVGIHLLKGDFEAAVSAILTYPSACLAAAQDPERAEHSTISSDDRDRALAIHCFQTGETNRALSTLPRKFSAENQLIRHLSGRNPSDYYGALQTIQRNLRLMYVHAYQSVIWNLAATHRWQAHGDKVIEGDLVLVNEHKEPEASDSAKKDGEEEIDADGEVVIQPTKEDRAVTDDDRFERARPLTAEEVASGKFSIFDIVLPTPGYDILYPQHMVAFYEQTMAKDEYGNLDPHDMRRKWRDISLSGSYRKLLSRPSDVSFEIKEYREENEQFVETDAELLRKASAPSGGHAEAEEVEKADEQMKDGQEPEQEPLKTAVILKLQLGSSQYATMALRELMKGGLETYKMDFGGGR